MRTRKNTYWVDRFPFRSPAARTLRETTPYPQVRPQGTQLRIWLTAVMFALASTAAASANQSFLVRGSLWIEGSAADRAEVSLRRYTTSLERRRAELGLQALPEPVERTKPRQGEFAFSVPAMPIGNWHLEISHPSGDFVPLRIDLVPLDGDLLLPPIELQRGHEVTATVADPDGSPLEGALVLFDAMATPLDETAQKIFPVGVRTPRQVRRTNGQGKASARLPIGERAVRAAHTDHLMDEQQGEAVRFDLQLHAGVPVDLRLQRGNGRPAVGAVVRMGQFSVPVTVADEQGHVTLVAHDRADVTYQVESSSGEMARISLPARAGTAPESSTMRSLEPVRRITGRAIDGASGKALPGALVFTNWRPGDAVVTDRRGGFELPILDFRTQSRLRLHHPDFVATVWPVTEQLEDIGDVLLQSAQTLAVRTLQANGDPLAGARVEVTAPTRSGSVRRSTVTDAAGQARIFGLPKAGQATLRARALGLAVAEVPLQLGALADRRDQGEAIEVIVRNGLLLTGTVVDDLERPVPGAMVLLQPVRGPSIGPQGEALREAASNPDLIERSTRAVHLRDETAKTGRFLIPDAPPGTYEISVLAPGFTPLGVPGVEIREADATGELAGAPSTPTIEIGTLVIAAAASIRGVVLDPEGEPVGGAEVRSSREQVGVSNSEPSTTNSRGEFQLTGLARGKRYVLEARTPGFGPALLQEIEAPNNDVTLELTPGADLLVRLRDTRGPVSDAHIFASRFIGGGRSARPASSEPGDLNGSTDAGHYLLAALAPGTWQIAVHRRNAAQWNGQVEITARQPTDGPQIFDIDLGESRTITVRLVDRQGKLVAGGVHFEVSRSNSSVSRPVTPQASGDFRFEAPVDSLVVVTGRAPQYQSTTRRLEPGDGNVDLTLELDEGLEVGGTVLAPDGSPTAGAVVTWVSDGVWNGTSVPNTATDDGGRFRLAGLSASLGRLTAVDQDDRRGQVELDLRDSVPADVTVELAEGLLVHGVVLGLDETELASARISADSTGTGAVSHYAYLESATQPDFSGSWQLRLPGAGEWTLQARANQRVRTEKIRLDFGDSPEIVFDFAERHTLILQVRRNGQPLQGAVAFVAGGPATSDQSGRMVLRDLPAGEQQIHLRLPGGASRMVQATLPTETPIPVDFEVRTLRGQVVDASTSLGIAGAQLTATAEPAGEDFAVPAGHTTTDANGDFEVEVTDNGSPSWTYSVYVEGYESSSGPLVDGTRIEMRREGIAASLSMTDSSRFARLVVHDGSNWTQAVAQRNPGTGLLDVRGLAPGAWQGWVLAESGFAEIHLQVEAPGTEARPPVQVALSAYATVVVRSPSASHNNTHTALLLPTLFDPGYEAEGLKSFVRRSVAAAQFETTNDGSQATIRNVPTGSWILRLVGGDREPALPVTVASGQTVTVDVP